MSTPTLPLPCTAGQARVALNEALAELADGTAVADGLSGDTGYILDQLSISQASCNGLAAMLPTDDSKAITDDLNFKIASALSAVDINLGTVSQMASFPTPRWDLGAAVTGLLQDTGTAVKQLATDAGAAAGGAASQALAGLLPTILVLGLILFLIARTGAVKVAL